MDQVDWKEDGKVSGVKCHQQRLRSCYAYGTVATIESLHAIETGEMIELSEQQLIDCVKSCDNIFGGNFKSTYEYVKKKGLCTRRDYPSLDWMGECKCGEVRRYLKISDFGYISTEQELEDIVRKHPVTVSLDVRLGNFKDFSGDGIFCHSEHENFEYQRNHVVCVYGFVNNPNGTSYWLIKNSWGANWGDGGCAKIEKGNKTLGIGLYGIYPIGIEILTDDNVISELEALGINDDEHVLDPSIEVMRDGLRQNYFGNPQMFVQYKSGESSQPNWRED